jgi:SpoVK/Ycf46/Vps4 family AAA+-type ATPase
MGSSILADFISSANPLLWVHSIEEERLLVSESSTLLGTGTCVKIYVYDARNIIYDYEDKQSFVEVDSPVEAIQKFIQKSNHNFKSFYVDNQSTWDINSQGFPDNSLLIMLDAPFHMTDPSKVKHTNARLTRCIKNSIPGLLGSDKTIVFINHNTEVPIEIENVVTYVQHDLPNVSDMKMVVKSSAYSVNLNDSGNNNNMPEIELEEDELNKFAQQLTGLTQWQAENVLAMANRANAIEFSESKVNKRSFKAEVIRKEKSRLIQKSGILQILDNNWGMNEVGGMENLKQWAKDRSLIFKHEAREDGIDLPKGLCVVGPGGTGKSWVAQALGLEWDRAVLRLDIGACMGSLLGESEGKLIKALKDAEAQAPCILFVDEFEKLFAGAGGGVTDGGTFQRMYGTWLTWTQSKKADVFVVATTNSITSIPAPALRKGRFDEVMYVGLPGLKQRKEIFNIHLKKRGWAPEEYDIDLNELARKTPNRTGSEIEQIVIEGLIRKGKDVGFGKKFSVTTQHILSAINDVKIMAELNPEESKTLLEWAKSHRVMMANKEEDSNTAINTAVNTTGWSRSRNLNIPESSKININESEI